MMRILGQLMLPLLMLLGGGAAAAAPFHSDRISVESGGNGPDVVLIPGLSSSPKVWDATVAAIPGYRYHLVHVAGFDGAARAPTPQARWSSRSPRRSPATSGKPPQAPGDRRPFARRQLGDDGRGAPSRAGLAS